MLATNARSKILLCLCVAGLALAWLGLEALRLTAADSSERLIDLVALSAGGAAFLLGILGLARHFRQAAASAAPVQERAAARDAGAFPAGAAPAALRCLDQPALLVGETGRVLHMNGAAAAFLDARAVAPSAGIFQLVEPADLRQALAAARSGRGAARALLRLRDGGDIAVRVADIGFQAGMAIVFENAAAAPPPPPRPGGRWGAAVDPALSLAAAPIVALWADIADGRLRRLSTVKLTGGRVFPTLSLDFVIAGSDAAPEAAPDGRPFADIWPELAQALKGALVAAENAAALWRLVQGEMQGAGFTPAEPPPLLELSRLAAGCDPGWAGLGLDELAQKLDIGEADPARRLARVAAVLALGPGGTGLGTVGDVIGESGVISGDALKPAADAPAAGEPT